MRRSDVRGTVAAGCRIVAREGLAVEALGHVSARTADGGSMWLRCRGKSEYGVLRTTRSQVRSVSLETSGGDAGDGYSIPLEFPIHAELLKARPEIGAVVHVHPRYVVLCAAAGVPLRAVYGSFDWSGLQLVSDGIAHYGRARLIDDKDAAAELVSAMAGRDVCVMQGHGATVVGATVQDAVLKAVRLERLARFCWELAQVAPAGGIPAEIAAEDRAWYAERGPAVRGTGLTGAWNSYAAGVAGSPRLRGLRRWIGSA